MFSRLFFLVILLTALAFGAASCGDDPEIRGPRNPLPAEPAATAQTIRVVTPQPQALPQQPAAPVPAIVPPPVTPAEVAPTPVPARPVPARPSVVPPGRATGYLVSAPTAFRSGYSEGVSVSLFSAQNTPASGEVRLSLTRAGAPIASAVEYVEGAQTVFLNLPQTESGDDYTLEVSGPGFEDSAPMRMIDGAVIFVETDKPIYKPGQDMRVRVLRLDAELKPLPGEVTVEITDAKGIKVFKKQTTSDDYGMASLTMPLSTEPNLGVWKVTARYGEQTAQVDARVERYTLPRYEIDVTLPKDWVLADELIEGAISAEYSFGKPVRGEVEIVAYRYVGTWERFASFNEDIDGEVSFDLPAAQYVAGVPAAGGQGNVRLDITVSERSTGYVETTTHLLTVAESPINVRLIAESPSFKPSLPFSILMIAETPDNMPVDTDILLNISYYDENLDYILDESLDVPTINGKALVSIEPPKDAVWADVYTDYGSYLAINASYSPSDSFIHLEQTGELDLGVGAVARFTVHATRSGRFYYEIVSRGRVVFSDVSDSSDISFVTAPAMAPSSRLIVYQILPDNEVAADYISFDVSGGYPMEVSIDLSSDEIRPGDSVEIGLTTQGRARVGLAAVDRSVFILSENRLNLQQVFAKLERLYMQPQVELHIDDDGWPPSTATRGAKETFADAGLVIMTNKTVPEGEVHQMEVQMMAAPAMAAPAMAAAPVVVKEVAVEGTRAAPVEQLAEVQRVRQFFPETWLWTDLVTDDSGRATVNAEAPDSITTWMFRAVSLSKEHGLGVAEAEMRVFQPFFVEMDLPYSAVRGEEFPVKVSLYNYLDSTQEFFVELEDSDDYELLDESLKSVTVEGSDLGVVEFRIRLTSLGRAPIEITARSRDSADAVVRDLLVEPEGVSHEIVENAIMSAGDTAEFVTSPPVGSVPGSARAQVAVSGSYLSQTLEGLENLLQMPFGCGEQNMILFAPNVFVARYLEETGQLKPEVMAKAEHLMTTGYQRELTYRRADGSFSAFGDSDDSGSLWLTAFVLKTFAQADGLIYMDDTVLRDAAYWIAQRQRSDGSFEPVGFLHHQELLGGLQGNTALTAYVAIALLEASESDRADSAIAYLERQLDAIEDPYTMAIVTYALELGGSGMAGSAYDRLMSMARQDENGIYWGDDDTSGTLPANGRMSSSAGVETTGYATLALVERGDRIGAASAARWLVSQRNAFGGFDSTQDTVVGLQALIEFAAQAKFDVDMTITLTSGAWSRQIEVNAANSDVVQIITVPIGEPLRIAASKGDGEAVVQVVNRFNMPEVETRQVEAFRINVDYSADDIEVNDRIEVSVEARFTPPTPVEAGMVVIDVAIPTGFAPVTETVEALVKEHHKLKRYEIAGRKVILYVEDMRPNESISLEFEAVALHPVQAQPVTSQIYSYYSPHWRAQTLGQSVSVGAR